MKMVEEFSHLQLTSKSFNQVTDFCQPYKAPLLIGIYDSNLYSLAQLKTTLIDHGLFTETSSVLSTFIQTVKRRIFNFIVIKIEQFNDVNFEIIKEIKKYSPVSTSIIIYAKEYDDVDIALALDAGADDVVTIAANESTLIAKLSVYVRRSIEMKALKLDEINIKINKLEKSHQFEKFKYKERLLLQLLLLNLNKEVSREDIFRWCWSNKNEDTSRMVDVLVSRLRKKLFIICGETYNIFSVHGIGFRMEGILNTSQ